MNRTRILTTIRHTDDAPLTFDVALTFDEVLDRVAPITPPSSALEYRAACLYEPLDGTGRIFCPPQLIGHVIEHALEED